MFASCIYPGLENRETRGTRHPACVIACCQQSSQTQETKGRYNRGVNIRDERSVSEQVKSGLRLAGWVLLALALIFVLLGSTGFLLGKGDYNQPIYRLLGACGLLAISTVMFATVRHWAKWLIGVMGFLALKTVFALAFGSSVTRPRLWFVEFALLLGLAALLCKRYLKREPEKIEAVGLVGLVVALSFTLMCNSNAPLLLGVAVLAFIQLAHRITRGSQDELGRE